MFNSTSIMKQKIHNRSSRTGFRSVPFSEFRLNRRERLQNAVNSVAFMLFSQESVDFIKTIEVSLEILGRSINVDRVVIWKNYVENGILRVFRHPQWNNPDQKDIFTREIIDPVPGDLSINEILPNWENIFSDQSPVYFIDRNMREPFRSIAMSNGIRSILIIPVFSMGSYWGFISFLTYSDERFYTSAEKELLRTGGILIASAIENHETSKELMRERDEAQTHTKAKSEFLSRMSHELRTPTNAIIGMADVAKISPEKTEQCLEKIGASSRHLLGILNDVLDISKIEVNKLELDTREFDLGKMLQNVSDVIKVKTDEKKQNFVLKGDAFERMILGDELRLSQVLLNLLSNAIKFTPEEGNILLSCKVRESTDNEAIIRFEVKDSGIGLTSLQQEKLFQPFEQTGKDTARKYGGTGLGLVICKRLVGLMGGDIWVESESSKGTSFVFEIKAFLGNAAVKEGKVYNKG